MTETWVSIADCPGYEASSQGRIRSWRPASSTAPLRQVPIILKPYLEKNGYMRTTLYGPSGKKKVSVHRLVAEAFLGPAPDGRPNVDHVNGVRDDNRVENLRWASHAENQIHRAELAGNRHSMECPHCGGEVSLSRRNHSLPTRTLELIPTDESLDRRSDTYA